MGKKKGKKNGSVKAAEAPAPETPEAPAPETPEAPAPETPEAASAETPPAEEGASPPPPPPPPPPHADEASVVADGNGMEATITFNDDVEEIPAEGAADNTEFYKKLSDDETSEAALEVPEKPVERTPSFLERMSRKFSFSKKSEEPNVPKPKKASPFAGMMAIIKDQSKMPPKDNNARALAKPNMMDNLFSKFRPNKRVEFNLEGMLDDDVRGKYARYDFPFENLVLEGAGGHRGLAYAGAAKVLQTIGVLQTIRRFAGVGTGAIPATLLALGCSPEELAGLTDESFYIMFEDSKLAYLSMMPNMIKGYGIYKGQKFLDWLGKILADKTGNADITFAQLFKLYETELCIVVTNLNAKMEEYCHVKTTPDMPIRIAIRMSMSIPGFFQPVKYNKNGRECLFVDGGICCNYPIHSFDGWWLDMDSKNSFFNRMGEVGELLDVNEMSDRFDSYNNTTLGVMVYSNDDPEDMRTTLKAREGKNKTVRPDTVLAGTKDKAERDRLGAQEFRKRTKELIGDFLNAVRTSDEDGSGTINRKELEDAFLKESENINDGESLPTGVNVAQLFDALDVNKDGEITYQEVVQFFENQGYSLMTKDLKDEQGTAVNSLSQYHVSYQQLLNLLAKRVHLEPREFDRTVGINTDYVHATDLFLELSDKEFALQQGVKGTRAFLKKYVRKWKLKPRPEEIAPPPADVTPDMETIYVIPADEEVAMETEKPAETEQPAENHVDEDKDAKPEEGKPPAEVSVA
ncbi:uncharacterized protein [Branchiostoma lanceolatum]|uniref:uncharacterized protein isoform X2 n=1 Tax=Branchiostoma lanceolatum TaxID=7740 RepID=UPI0034557C79